MRKIFLLVVIFLVSYAKAYNAKEESIEYYIKLAREHYPLSHNTQLLDNALTLTLKELNTHFIPQLRLSGKLSYQSEVTTLPFDSLPSAFSFDYKPLSKDQYQFVLEVSQPLLDMAHFVKKDMTKAQIATQKEDVALSLYQINQSVIEYFFALLLLNEQINQNKLHIKELSKNLRNLEILYKNGAMTKEALNKIHIEILNTQKIAEELQSQKEIALHSLCSLTAHQVSENPLVPNFDEQKVFLQSVQHYLYTKAHSVEDRESSNLAIRELRESGQAIFTYRPENMYFMAKEREMQTQKKLERAKIFPYIDLFVQGGYGNPSLNFLRGEAAPYYIAGVRLSWDLSNLYSISQHNELIHNQILRLGSQREAFILKSQIALNKHIKNANNLLAQMQDDEQIVALREKILQSQEAKLKQGVLSINDFITDINNLNLARLQQNYTKIEFLMQIYHIKQILNVWQYE